MLWHGHEMLFGFAGATVIGTLLTALPSWAGLDELHGRPLAALAGLWLAGRAVFWAAPWLPGAVVAVVDLLLWPALLAVLTAPVWGVANRLYRLLLPILLALALANAMYHAAAWSGDLRGAERGLRAAVWTLMVLFTLKGGVLTPVFTGNALLAAGRGEPAACLMPLEALAWTLLVALAAADLMIDAPATATAVLALLCAVVHGVRVVRWRGGRVLDQSLLPSLHLGFVWLLIAFALKAAAAIGSRNRPSRTAGIRYISPDRYETTTAWCLLHELLGVARTMCRGLSTRWRIITLLSGAVIPQHSKCLQHLVTESYESTTDMISGIA